MLSGLALPNPSGGLLAACPTLGTAGGVGLEFPAFVVGFGVHRIAVCARRLAFKVGTVAVPIAPSARGVCVCVVELGD